MCRRHWTLRGLCREWGRLLWIVWWGRISAKDGASSSKTEDVVKCLMEKLTEVVPFFLRQAQQSGSWKWLAVCGPGLPNRWLRSELQLKRALQVAQTEIHRIFSYTISRAPPQEDRHKSVRGREAGELQREGGNTSLVVLIHTFLVPTIFRSARHQQALPFSITHLSQ